MPAAGSKPNTPPAAPGTASNSTRARRLSYITNGDVSLLPAVQKQHSWEPSFEARCGETYVPNMTPDSKGPPCAQCAHVHMAMTRCLCCYAPCSPMAEGCQKEHQRAKRVPSQRQLRQRPCQQLLLLQLKRYACSLHATCMGARTMRTHSEEASTLRSCSMGCVLAAGRRSGADIARQCGMHVACGT